MQFQILEDKDSVTHVAVHGRINGIDIAPPADPLRHLLGPSAYERNVVLHLADAEYIDSMAVAWLVSCNKRFRESGGKMVLHSLHPSVMKILKLLKIDSILNIAPDAVAAHKVVREKPHEHRLAADRADRQPASCTSSTRVSGSADEDAFGDVLAAMPPGKAFSEIVAFAVEANASDLFFLTEEGAIRVALRRMGRLETMFALSPETGRNILNVMKADAGIDLGDRRRPHEGRYIQLLGDHSVDLRINIIPTLHGEDVAVRIHDSKSGLRTLEQIGFLRSELSRMQSILENPSGLMLVTGATATGKTTTLYACLQHLNAATRKINTIEDPVEYVLPGLRQSQVHTKIGLDFPELLRNILRQSPDVIMVGEIRDEETASTAVRAANSGTLVLSTLHAPIAAGAVQSMLALNVNRYFLSNCLLGVVAQRLVRTLCPECRVPYDITESPGTFADVRPLLEQGQGDYIFGHGACAKCQYQGFNGRTAIVEFMTFNRKMRELVARGCSAEEIQQAAIEHGMIEFKRAAMVKVAQGVTTTEEILREMPAEQLGLEM